MNKYIVLVAIMATLLLSGCEISETVLDDEIDDSALAYTDLISGMNIDDNSWGSASALEEDQFSIQDMLLYAIQDEYSARTEYEYIIREFNVETPFSNIIKAEIKHIEMLIPLFEVYDIEVPEDASYEHIVELTTLVSTFEVGVDAEILNIAMYDLFLTQNLPNDIRETFTYLRDASVKHLAAFEKGLAKNS